MSCVVCQQENTKDVCSECLQPFCGIQCFVGSQHALICAGGKRVNPEVTDQEVLQMFEADNVDGIRELLEDKRMPTNLISLRYARSIEMATLLRDNEGDPFEYIGDGRIALDECMKYFDVRPLLPQTQNELVRGVVAKMKKVRDIHLNLFPEIKIEFRIRQVDIKITAVGQLLNETLKTMKSDLERVSKGTTGKKPPYLVELGKDFDFTEFEHLYRHLLHEGFVPMLGALSNPVIAVGDKDKGVSFDEMDIAKFMEDQYLKRYDKRTLLFWNGVRFMRAVIENWSFYSANTLDQRAQESPESFSLIMNGYYDKVFKESRRAKTEMQMFRTVDSKVIHQVPPESQMIPVTRYAQGMKGGLFFKGPKKSYCGTFYYNEPESKVFLRYKKKLVAKDKRDAADKLGISGVDSPDGKENEYEKALRIALSKPETESLMFTPREFIDFVKDTGIPHSRIFEANPRLNFIIEGPHERLMIIQPERKYYCGRLLGFYALQDFLDQPLCTAAYKQGYDIVVLTHMVGSRQMVTEVLDVRSREESFANLHYLV